MFLAYQIILLFSVVFCAVRADIHLTSGWLQTKHVTNGNQCTEGHVLTDYNIFVFFLLCDSQASEFYTPTFRNTLFHLHRQCK